MTKIHRHALVRHSAARMFGLVKDVAGYPRRFAWCESAQVLEQDDTHMLRGSNCGSPACPCPSPRATPCRRPRASRCSSSTVPSRRSRASGASIRWPEDACKVSLDLDFEVAGKLVGGALAVAFGSLGDRMVDDFCREADRSDD
jgi:ribosome-associated toxin RatA of RatAB toxin-antitoxin module